MNLDDKLRRLKAVTSKAPARSELDQQLDYLRHVERVTKKLPAQRAKHGIEEYVEGRLGSNSLGEFFFTEQSLPFGRPYGKLRIGDIPTADFSSLNIFMGPDSLPPPAGLVFLDTETTGLAGGTGTVAFLIGIGIVEGARFVIRQYFLRDYPEEKAVLQALAEALEPRGGLVTFNGKTFDAPLLQTRYALARLHSPLDRLVHLDLLHPARRLWKLRLESCELKHLEKEILGIAREGDVDGSEIPGIYFDYLRTGDARGLQPVFFHNALDIVTLAALTVELARIIAEGDQASAPSLDLFSLSRIFDRAGNRAFSLSACRRALDAGLPESVETRALWHLALQHKRHGQFDEAVTIWSEVVRREPPFAIHALEELAIHFEHRRREPSKALEFTQLALQHLRESNAPAAHVKRMTHRMERLKRKSNVTSGNPKPLLAR